MCNKVSTNYMLRKGSIFCLTGRWSCCFLCGVFPCFFCRGEALMFKQDSGDHQLGYCHALGDERLSASTTTCNRTTETSRRLDSSRAPFALLPTLPYMGKAREGGLCGTVRNRDFRAVACIGAHRAEDREPRLCCHRTDSVVAVDVQQKLVWLTPVIYMQACKQPFLFMLSSEDPVHES